MTAASAPGKEGTEPNGLSLDNLYRAPVEWEQQRNALGRNPVGTGGWGG